MSNKQYPLIRDKYRKAKSPGEKNYSEKQGHPCVVCGRLTTGGWWVQVGWMRGDDEIAAACYEHIKDKAAVLAAWESPPEPKP